MDLTVWRCVSVNICVGKISVAYRNAAETRFRTFAKVARRQQSRLVTVAAVWPLESSGHIVSASLLVFYLNYSSITLSSHLQLIPANRVVN